MKALIAQYTGRGYKPWEVREHDSENNRSFLWTSHGSLDFRVNKKTGKVEFPPTQYSNWNPKVILTEKDWENEHKPDSYQLGKIVQNCRDSALLRQIANLLGVDCSIPEFPLKETETSDRCPPA